MTQLLCCGSVPDRTLPASSAVMPIGGMPVFAFPVTTTNTLATGGCLRRGRCGCRGAGMGLCLILLCGLLTLGWESLLALGGLACWGRSTVKGIVRLCVRGRLLRCLTRVRRRKRRCRVSRLWRGGRRIKGLLRAGGRGSDPAGSIRVASGRVRAMVIGSSCDVRRVLAAWVHGSRLGRRSISGIRRRGLLRLLEATVSTTTRGGIALLGLLRGVAARGTCVTGGAGSWVSGTIIGGVTSVGVGVCVIGRAMVLARLMGL